MEAVHHYEGTVNQVMGDGIMALFGAPLALTRERGQRGSEAWALRLLGETAARVDPPPIEQADHSFGQAMALATELGTPPRRPLPPRPRQAVPLGTATGAGPRVSRDCDDDVP